MSENNSFLTTEELNLSGFKSIGKNVYISRFARFYSPNNIKIGNNVRIDDFCILSGSIKLGNFIHISAYSALYGKYGIEMKDYSGISPRCTIFSASDDFSGEYMVGPMIPDIYTNVSGGKVIIEKYVQIGASCVVLPNVTIHEGVAVGAMSLITGNLNEWSIYHGIPAKFYKKREKRIIELQNNFITTR